MDKPKPLTLGKFRKMTEHLDDSVAMFIRNDGYDSYGIFEMSPLGWEEEDNELCFNYGSV